MHQLEKNSIKEIKLGLIQPNVEPYAVQRNLEYLTLKLSQLKRKNVQFVLLPEFFPTGNTLEPELLKVAIQSSENIEEWIRKQSRQLNMIIAGAYLSLEDRHVYNKFVIQEPDGRVACHYKTQSPSVESRYYQTSQEKDYIVDTHLGKVALITCVEMLYADISHADYNECSLILIGFAIPNYIGIVMPSLIRRLTEVPQSLAKKNGIPVALCSMGGTFHGPFRYAGRSGIYMPSGPITDPLLPGEEGALLADITLGPYVEPPDLTVKIEAGLPLFMRILNSLFKRRAKRQYKRNLKKWL